MSWGPPPLVPPRRGPSLGLPLALAGTVLALVGLFALDWAKSTDFFDASNVVNDHKSQFNVFTQVYFLGLWVPLLIVTVAVCVVVTLGPTAARVGTAVIGSLGGLSLIGLVVFIESGAVGTSQSRDDAAPLLVAIAVAGVISIGLGVGAYFERRGVFARSLAGILATVAVIAHLAVVNDLFADNSDADFGAWLPAVGFALLAVATVLPYRVRAAAAAPPSNPYLAPR